MLDGELERLHEGVGDDVTVVDAVLLVVAVIESEPVTLPVRVAVIERD